MENITGSVAERTTVLPFNNEAEQSVLGAVLLDAECLNRILDIVRPEYFYNENHREIFSAMHRLFRAGSPVDIITVLNELVGIGVFTVYTGGSGAIGVQRGNICCHYSREIRNARADSGGTGDYQ